MNESKLRRFGKTMRRLRLEKHLTQEQFARVIVIDAEPGKKSRAISSKTVARWERGESEPDVKARAALSKYFGVSIEQAAGVNVEDWKLLH